MITYRIAFKDQYDPTYYYQTVESDEPSEEEAIRLFREKFPSQEIIAVYPLHEYDIFYVTIEYHRARISGISKEEAKMFIEGGSKSFWKDKVIKRHNKVQSVKEIKKEEEE